MLGVLEGALDRVGSNDGVLLGSVDGLELG